MQSSRILEMMTHVPRRLAREALVLVELAQLFVFNRLGRKRVTAAAGPVVSLTTHGNRSRTVYLAIESIARGGVRPSRLILWIDDDALLKNLPPTIRRLQGRGLEVRPSSNYGPHTKYYPYLESTDRFDRPLVTADDDVIYPKYWLRRLAEANGQYPQYVNCFWAHVVVMDENGIESSGKWANCETNQPCYRHVAAGVGGVIYPPAFLAELKRAGTGFESECPKNDDLWLHVQALRAGYKVRQIYARLPYFSFRGIPGSQVTALWQFNVGEHGNDPQIRATYKDADIQRLRTDS